MNIKVVVNYAHSFDADVFKDVPIETALSNFGNCSVSCTLRIVEINIFGDVEHRT